MTNTDSFGLYSGLRLKPNGIRLLQIQPCISDLAVISCRLKTASLDDNENSSYFALSYVWGSPQSCQQILINGTIVSIRRNLWSFLWHARKTPDLRDRWLWIDALCIDQSNLRERAEQVQIMSAIFRRAKLVVSWLGFDDPALADLFHKVQENAISLNHCSKEQSTPVTASALESTVKEGLKACDYDSFYLNEYWTRTWIAQEVLSAHRLALMHESTIIDWKFFWLGLFGTPEFSEDFKGRLAGPRGSDDLMAYRYYFQREEPSQSLSIFDVLSEYKLLQCSDPRDRIYAIRALLRSGDSFSVSYSDGVEELALRVLLHFKATPTDLTWLMRYLGIRSRDFHQHARQRVQQGIPDSKSVGLDRSAQYVTFKSAISAIDNHYTAGGKPFDALYRGFPYRGGGERPLGSAIYLVASDTRELPHAKQSHWHHIQLTFGSDPYFSMSKVHVAIDDALLSGPDGGLQKCRGYYTDNDPWECWNNKSWGQKWLISSELESIESFIKISVSSGQSGQASTVATITMPLDLYAYMSLRTMNDWSIISSDRYTEPGPRAKTTQRNPEAVTVVLGYLSRLAFT